MEDSVSDRKQSTILAAGEHIGLILPHKSVFQNEIIRHCHVTKAQLCAPIFEACVVEHCQFEKCDISGARFFDKTAWHHCQFKQTDLSGSGLSNSVFTGCTFIRCDFRQTSLAGCTFIDCVFENCKIIDNVLDAANTRNCRFTGKLQEVNFIGQQPETVLLADFDRCLLEYVAFENCNLQQIVPPADARHVYFNDMAQRAAKALACIATQDDNATSKLLKRRLKHYERQHGGIINLNNLAEIEGKEFAGQLMALLEQAAP